MEIRFYQSEDYEALVRLYKTSQDFLLDEETDARERLDAKVKRDPESLLVAAEGDRLVGSVSLIEDGRIALLFRLVVDPSVADVSSVLAPLVEESECILSKRGYKEVHNTVPVENTSSTEARKKLGFTQGKNYSWFWKRISIGTDKYERI